MLDMDLLTRSLQPNFPRLDGSNYTQTSPTTPAYNCIAWAAGDNSRWWQPDSQYNYYWPDGVPREHTLTAYTAAYQTLGYETCDGGELEKGFEKVVIYIDPALGTPTHAARQLPDGQWTSKLGQNVDISHQDPETLTGGKYGTVAQFMKRRLKVKRRRR